MSQTLSDIEIDDQVSIGEKSFIQCIFLKEGLARIEEAGTIEDENQEHQNNKTDI